MSFKKVDDHTVTTLPTNPKTHAPNLSQPFNPPPHSLLSPLNLNLNDTSLNLSLTDPSLLLPQQPRLQISFVDQQSLRNVFESIANNQNALLSLQKVAEQIEELERCGRKLVAENVRLFVENTRYQAELRNKDKSLEELNCKLTQIILRMQHTQQQQPTQSSSTIATLRDQNTQLKKQVDYLENLLIGKKHYDGAEMEKMIRKASVAMVERDTLEVRLHDLLQEVEVLRERERERERGVGGEKMLSLETVDMEQLISSRASKSELPSESEPFLVMSQRFTKIQQINNALTEKLSQMSMQSQTLSTALKTQSQQIQTMKAASLARQKQFQSKLNKYEQQAQKQNKIVEKSLALVVEMQAEVNRKTEALRAEMERSRRLAEENQGLRREKERGEKEKDALPTMIRVKSEMEVKMAETERRLGEALRRESEVERKLVEEKRKVVELEGKRNQFERRFSQAEVKLAEVQKKYAQYQKKLRQSQQRYQDLKINSEQNESRMRNTVNVKDNRILQLVKQVQQLKDTQKDPKLIESFQKQMLSLKKKMQQYENSIVPQLIKQLQDTQTKLKQSPAIITKKSQNRQLTNHQMDRVMLNLSKQIQRLKSLNSDLSTKKSLLENDLQKSKKQITSLKQQITSLKQSPVKPSSTSSPLKYEHNTKQCLEQREQLKAIVLELERENSEYLDKIDDLELEIMNLKGIKPTMKSKIGKVNLMIEQLEKQ